MALAGFDIATTTGAAFLDGTKIVEAVSYRAKGTGDAEIFCDFRQWFNVMLGRYQVTHVAIEQPLVTNIELDDHRPNGRPGKKYNPVTMATYLRLYGLRGHAIQICKARRIPVIECHQATWRKSFTGNGRATKEETLALAQRLVPDLKSKDAAEAVGVVWHLAGVLKSAQMFRPGELFSGAA
jgi:hypothetical protein